MAGSRPLPEPAQLWGAGLPITGPRTRCRCGGLGLRRLLSGWRSWGAGVPWGDPRVWWEGQVQDVETGVGSVRPQRSHR